MRSSATESISRRLTFQSAFASTYLEMKWIISLYSRVREKVYSNSPYVSVQWQLAAAEWLRFMARTVKYLNANMLPVRRFTLGGVSPRWKMYIKCLFSFFLLHRTSWRSSTRELARWSQLEKLTWKLCTVSERLLSFLVPFLYFSYVCINFQLSRLIAREMWKTDEIFVVILAIFLFFLIIIFAPRK